MPENDRTPARARSRMIAVSGGGVASGCLALALLGLTGVATWSSFATYEAARASGEARTLAQTYDAARFAVGAEESTERKYRLEPGPNVLAKHLAAWSDVNTAMTAVARAGGPEDRATAADVTARNAAYRAGTTALFAAVDRGDETAESVLDEEQVDPIFDEMQTTVYGQADRHETADAEAQQRLMAIETFARWATSLAVAVGAALIGLFYQVRRHHRRDTAAQAALTAHQATHDALTGLPNRLHFGQLLEGALAASAAGGGSTGVVLIDLDRFKEINDTLGHHYGDKLLQQVGPRLRGALRSGQIIARLGGDEFALLVPCTGSGEQSLAELRTVAQRVVQALQEPFLVDEVRLAVEASAGIALSGDHGNSAEDLLQRADIAMYMSKSRHQEVTVYDRTLDSHSPRKLALLAQLRGAIDHGELVLHYQPLVTIDGGAVRGVEALIRWQHPQEGLLPPSEFIPLAEGSGLIHELTRHVLDQACRQARAWSAAGRPLVVSVNISARCLLDVTLPDCVAAALDATGLSPHLLKLEITESAIIADPVRAQTVITRLSELGVALSIDDFGTGYTSLSYLRDLPVTELKIDRSFVSRMLDDRKDAVIVRTGVELADRLGLASVAEGIEDEDVLRALHALGCTTAQGYHLSRPLPAAELERWITERAGRPALLAR